MQKITPFLWFDNQAEEAAAFYTSLLQNSKSGNASHYGEEGAKISGKPTGSVMTVPFQLDGQDFIALNGGPIFTFTPAISFFVNRKTKEEIDDLWKMLSASGTVLMELGKYPFSEKFGWVQDKFGVSWQLNYSGISQNIAPFFMFVGKQHGKAEEAINYYISLFKNSNIIKIERYGLNEGEPQGTVKYASFSIGGQEFMAIDSGIEHQFTFSEAISFVVHCESQGEVDYFWEKLSESGEKGQCGWLKDKFGISWQVVPTVLGKMMQDKNREKAKRVVAAMLQMKKIDINILKQAYDKK